MVGEPVRAFDRFPLLVWEKILQFVEDPSDFMNLFWMSRETQFAMEEDLFQHQFALIFPHIFKKLETKDIFRLCSTNKLVASVILRWFQFNLDEDYLRLSNSSSSNEESDLGSLVLNASFPEDLDFYTEILLDSGSDSFTIPYSVVLSHWFLNCRAGIEAALKFLRLFGHRIWNCSLAFDTTYQDDPRHIPDEMVWCLELLPNIVHLEVSVDYDLEDLPDAIPVERPPSFPLLPNLKSLCVNRNSGNEYVDLIRLHADQLKYLNINGANISPDEIILFSKLTSLRLSWLDYGGYGIDVCLKPFFHVPLNRLAIEMKVSNYDELGRKFLLFNQFGGSLESLEVCFTICKNLERMKYNTLSWATKTYLPKLKNLVLTGYKGNLQFLTGMPALQSLTFEDHMFQTNGTIQLDHRTTGILNSNIWSLLNNMQEIILKTKLFWTDRSTNLTFTRKEADKHKHF